MLRLVRGFLGTGTRVELVMFQAAGDPVLYLSNPEGMSREVRGNLVEGINDLNRLRHQQVGAWNAPIIGTSPF